MRGRIISLRLHGEKRNPVATRNNLRTGCSVPDSGIYRVKHSQHQLPKEVTLIGNQPFPRCSKCAEPVYFELVRSAPAMGTNANAFSVALYQLPEMVEQEDDLVSGSSVA